jgi:hypothetical protein
MAVTAHPMNTRVALLGDLGAASMSQQGHVMDGARRAREKNLTEKPFCGM